MHRLIFEIIKISSTHENQIFCIPQKKPVRTLSHLVNISILIESSKASYHAVYDLCTIDFLRQAGVNVNFIRLEDLGIFENDYIQLMEKIICVLLKYFINGQ
jgi:hypothetical protein